jgi:hypothetical protein
MPLTAWVAQGGKLGMIGNLRPGASTLVEWPGWKTGLNNRASALVFTTIQVNRKAVINGVSPQSQVFTKNFRLGAIV